MQLIDLNVEGGKLAVSFDKKGGNFKVFWKDQLNLYFRELLKFNFETRIEIKLGVRSLCNFVIINENIKRR
jgi:hypothetical protein